MLLLLMLFFYAAQADALTSWTKHKINIVFCTFCLFYCFIVARMEKNLMRCIHFDSH